MRRFLRLIPCISLFVALCASLFGCSRNEVTAPNAAPPSPPNATPEEARTAMIKWHKEHDKR